MVTDSKCQDEQHAARVLGYDQTSWNEGPGEFEHPASTAKTWVEMTGEEKAALVVLGYSERSWDTRMPYTSYKLWRDLTGEQKAAAEVLGYKASNWNDWSEKQPAHSDKAWAELVDEKKVALQVLGFTEKLWDYGTSPLPSSAFKTWNKLNVCGEYSFCRVLRYRDGSERFSCQTFVPCLFAFSFWLVKTVAHTTLTTQIQSMSLNWLP